MSLIKLIAVAVATLGTCGLIAGAAKKVAVKKEEAGESNVVAKSVEVVVSLPAQASEIVATVAGTVVGLVIGLFPVTVPLLVLCSKFRNIFGLACKVLLVTCCGISAYEYAHKEMQA